MFRRIIRRLRKSPAAVQVSPVVAPPADDPDPDLEPPPDVEVDTEQLVAWLAEEQDLVLVDIREPYELQHGHAEGALLLRMNDIPSRLDALPAQSARLVIYCAAGVRSHGVAHWLREQGWADAWSLTSGFHGAVEAGFSIVRPE
jgi:rhodanese-related sulfurtransferase